MRLSGALANPALSCQPRMESPIGVFPVPRTGAGARRGWCAIPVASRSAGSASYQSLRESETASSNAMPRGDMPQWHSVSTECHCGGLEELDDRAERLTATYQHAFETAVVHFGCIRRRHALPFQNEGHGSPLAKTAAGLPGRCQRRRSRRARCGGPT